MENSDSKPIVDYSGSNAMKPLNVFRQSEKERNKNGNNQFQRMEREEKNNVEDSMTQYS